MVSLADYVQRFDRPEFHERVKPAAVLVACAVLAGMVALGAWVPRSRDAIQLAPAWALGCIAAYAAVSGAAHLLCRRQAGSVPGLTLHLVSAAVLHGFLSSLIVDSPSWPARFAVGTMLLFTLGSHGEVLRATLDAPYLALASLLLVIPAAALRSEGDCLAYLLVLHGLGLYALFVMGHQAAAADRFTRQLEDERQALAASLLAQAHSSAARLEQQLVGLLGVHHDARNLLTTALLASGSVQRKLDSEQPPAVPELKAALQKVDSALRLVNTVFTSSLAAQARPEAEAFESGPAMQASVRDCRSQNASLHLQLDAPTGASLYMPGGAVSFRRIVDNLLLNAAEGNGATRARSLLVKVALEEGRYHLQLLDDGPGFPPEVLTGKRQRFTSKPRGSGLGLVTVDALVRAAGGVLVLDNCPEGGARVDVFLPLPGPAAQHGTGGRDFRLQR